MDYLSDYWTYHRCYEIPRSYAFWAAISTLSNAVHFKVFHLHGHIEIRGMMYIGLIGPQGGSKSTTCGMAKNYFRTCYPKIAIGPSRASPEILVKLMSDKAFGCEFQDHNQERHWVRPYSFFINEFKNFVGRSPMDMINFLTDVYGEKVYDGSTIARGVELIINPAVSVLMCETPEWFIRNIKTEILTGGIVRRFVLVYEKESPEPIPVPFVTTEAEEAKNRFLKRLVEAGTVVGEYKWGDARTLYEKWYRDNHARMMKEPSGAMRGYLKSKHVQAFKVMMLLDCANDKPMLLFTKDLFDTALALLDSPEQNMPKLFMASGRNELMPGQIKILEELERSGGFASAKLLTKSVESELNGLETSNVMRHLEDTGQIIKRQMQVKNEEGVAVLRWMILTPQKYNEMIKNGEIKEGK